ncbi:MAG: hypothetical protein QNK98_10965 [Yoonia sp.]|jgi:hypothetical protein|tara:strand:- start:142 stop:618 length:477 start_codon:yes stop_codon:yes gene_type:complete
MKVLFSAAVLVFFSTGGAIACPDFNASAGEAYRASGRELHETIAFNVRAGGNNYIWNCSNVKPGTDTGAGYFPTAPDFSFQLSGMGGYRLDLWVVSDCDSALLINTSSASWYYDDDDNGNLDPKIVLTRPVDGRIDVWIGTFDGTYCDAQLQLETFEK